MQLTLHAYKPVPAAPSERLAPPMTGDRAGSHGTGQGHGQHVCRREMPGGEECWRLRRCDMWGSLASMVALILAASVLPADDEIEAEELLSEKCILDVRDA